MVSIGPGCITHFSFITHFQHVGGSVSPHPGHHLLVSGWVLPHGGCDWPSLDELRLSVFSCAVVEH